MRDVIGRFGWRLALKWLRAGGEDRDTTFEGIEHMATMISQTTDLGERMSR